MIKMATKSFLKNITIKNSKSAKSFISAIENAEKKERKKIAEVGKNVTNKESIKKMFGD